MKKIIFASTLLVLLNLGCDSKPRSAGSQPTATPPAPKVHAEGEGHTHQKGGHGDHAERDLGVATIADVSARVVLHGDPTPGKELDVDVHLTGNAANVTAVRLWIGTEDGKGAMKAKVTANKEEAHNHVEVPAPLASDARLCIELEMSNGMKHVGSLALPR